MNEACPHGFCFHGPQSNMSASISGPDPGGDLTCLASQEGRVSCDGRDVGWVTVGEGVESA